jgi:ABC-type uncharacterized transport system permease subunit
MAFRRARGVCDTRAMNASTLLPWLAGGFYVAATALIVHVLRDASRQPLLRGALAIAALGVAAHLGFQLLVLIRIGAPDLHFFASLSLVGLAMAALTVVVGWFRPIAAVGAVVFPIAALMLLLDHVYATPTPSSTTSSWQITLHAVLALLAYATLSIAALVAVMLAVQERALRAHRVNQVLRLFPPLTMVEALLFQLIGAGFVLLSLTLLTGLLFVEDMLAQHLLHKTVLSIAAWITFGALLLGRLRYGWRGRVAVRWTLVGMTLLLLAFVGSKFVLEIVLQRGG